MIAFLLFFLFAFTFQQAEAEQHEEQSTQFLGGLFNKVKNGIKHVAGKIHGGIKKVAHHVHKGVGHVINKLPLPSPIKNIASGIHKAVGHGVSTLHKAAVGVVKTVHAGAKHVVKTGVHFAGSVASKIPIVGPLVQSLLDKLRHDREDREPPAEPEPEVPPPPEIDPKILAFADFLAKLPACPPAVKEKVSEIIDASPNDMTRRTAFLYLLATGLTVIDYTKVTKIQKKLRLYPIDTNNGIAFPKVFDPKVDKSAVAKALHKLKKRILKDFVYTTFHDTERGHFHKSGREFSMTQLPPHIITEPIDWMDDRFTSFVFFDGIGAPTLQLLGPADDNSQSNVQVYVADFDATIGQVEAEDGFEQLGGKIFFETSLVPAENEGEFFVQKTISQIQFKGETFTAADVSPQRWEFLKLVMRTNAFLLTTVKDHFLYAHLKWSQFGTRAIRQVFQNSPQHPLYKMLHLHTHRVELSNSNIFDLMAPENGGFHRLFAAKYDSLAGGMKTMSDSFRYQTWLDEIEAQGIDENHSQYVQGGKILYVLFQNYVTLMFNIMYPTQVEFSEDGKALQLFRRLSEDWNFDLPFNFVNFHQVITEFLFRVTFYHTQVSRAFPYVQDDTGIATRLEASWDKADDKLILKNNLVGHYWAVLTTGMNSMPGLNLMDERNSAILEAEYKVPFLEFLSQLDELNKAFPHWALPTFSTSTA